MGPSPSPVAAPEAPLHPASTRRRRAGEALLLVAVVGFVVGVEWAWLARDPVPDLTSDDAGIARATFAQLAAWRDGVPYRPAALLGAPYPPLVMGVGALGAWAAERCGGDPILGMLRGQSVYLVGLVLGAWAATRREGVAVAAAAALLAPTYGWWVLRGQSYVDMQLGACLVAAVGAWAASDRLRCPLPALLFGVALAAALLTKFSAVFFAGLPAAVAVAVAAAGLARRRGLVVGLAVLVAAGAVVAGASGRVGAGGAAGLVGAGALVVGVAVARAPAPDLRARLGALKLVPAGLLLAAPWYLGSLPVLRTFLDRNLAQAYDGEVYPVAEVWWVYPSVLLRGVVDEPMAVAALLGGVLARRRGLDGPGWLAAAMVVSGLVLLTLQPYRAPRYIVPAGGLLVVLAAGALGALGRLRTPVAGGLAAGAAAVWAASLGPTRPDDASAWTARVAWVPPSSEAALAQQRAAALDLRPRVHLALPGPAPSPSGFPGLGAALDPAHLAGVRTVALDGPYPLSACETLALRLVTLGADPYLACRAGPDADLRFTQDAGPLPGRVHVAGPLQAGPPPEDLPPPDPRLGPPGPPRPPPPPLHAHLAARLAAPG